MPRKRSQHRPPRETPAKEIAQLKHENKLLKKKVAALRKQVEQGVSTVPDIVEVEVLQTELHKWECPVCKAHEMNCFTTPSGKTIRYCVGCKTRYDDAA